MSYVISATLSLNSTMFICGLGWERNESAGLDECSRVTPERVVQFAQS